MGLQELFYVMLAGMLLISGLAFALVALFLNSGTLRTDELEQVDNSNMPQVELSQDRRISRELITNEDLHENDDDYESSQSVLSERCSLHCP